MEVRIAPPSRLNRRSSLRAGLRLLRQAAFLLAMWLGCHSAAADGVAIPGFSDPRSRPERPDLAGLRTVRFLTDDEFPPLHFAGPDGAPTGFAVELARAACDRLSIACTVQVRRFDTLLDSLAGGQGDVVVAAIPVTPALHRRFAITQHVFRFPARFSVRRDRELPQPEARTMGGRSVGVVADSAHEAFLAAFFPLAAAKPFPDLQAAQGALRRGEIDYLFADGLALALWTGGTDSAACCRFTGGPYIESAYFGEGIGLITRKDDDNLRRALDFALQQVRDDGKYAELYLRFFPVSPF